MTMTHAPDTGQGWSVEDLLQRPDDGNRYEITHGSLLVLEHNGKDGYEEVATVKAGETWRSERPFPLAVDPADFT